MSEPVVAICCPRERVALWPFLDGRQNLCRESVEWGIKIKIFERATIYIGEMRTILSQEVVARPEVTHALFLDADSVPPARSLKALLDRNVPVVSGLYFMRDERAHPVAYRETEGGYLRFNGTSYAPIREEVRAFLQEQNIPALWGAALVGDIGEPRPALLPVDVVGAGCLLVAREVLEQCSDWSMEDCGEDLAWCQRVRELGFPIYVDPGVIVAHVGMAPYSTAWFLRSFELEEEVPEPGPQVEPEKIRQARRIYPSHDRLGVAL